MDTMQTGGSLLSKVPMPQQPKYRVVHPTTGQVADFDDPAQARQQLAVWQQQAGLVNPQQENLNTIASQQAELGAQKTAIQNNPVPTHNPVNVEPMPTMEQVGIPQKQNASPDPIGLGMSALAGIFGGSAGAAAGGNTAGDIARSSVAQANQDYQDRIKDYGMRVAQATQTFEQAQEARNDRMKWKAVQDEDDYLDKNALFKQRGALGDIDAKKSGLDSLGQSTTVLGQKQLTQGFLQQQGTQITQDDKNYRDDMKTWVSLADTSSQIDARIATAKNEAEKAQLAREKQVNDKAIADVKLKIAGHEADARIAEAQARTKEAGARVGLVGQQIVESKARTHKINVEADNAGTMTPYQRELANQGRAKINMEAAAKGLIRGADGSYMLDPNRSVTPEQHQSNYANAYHEWNGLYQKYLTANQERNVYIGKWDANNNDPKKNKGNPLPSDALYHDTAFVGMTGALTQLRRQLGESKTRYEAIRDGQAKPVPDNWTPMQGVQQARQQADPRIQEGQDLMAGIHHAPPGITVKRIK